MQHAKSKRQYKSDIESTLQQLNNVNLQKEADEVHLLKRQLDDALKEKDLVVAENSRRMKEIQNLQQDIMNRGPTHSAHSANEDYVEVIATLEEETNRLRVELQKQDQEKIDCMKENIVFKKQIDHFSSNLESKDRELKAVKTLSEDYLKELKEIKTNFFKLQEKSSVQLQDIKGLISTVKSLETHNKQLTDILSQVKAKLIEGEKRVQESLKIAEDAVVEKNLTLVREKHSTSEIKRLENVLATLIREAGEKAKVEVSKAKDDYNNSVKNLSQEIVNLEMTINEKKLECDRRKREQEKAAKELEHMKYLLEETKINNMEMLNQLRQRIHLQESHIEKLTREKEVLFNKTKYTETPDENNEDSSNETFNELHEKLLESQNETAQVKIKLLDVLKEFKSFKDEANADRQEMERKEKHYKKIIKMKSDELEESKTSHQIQIQKIEETYSEDVKQLNENISTLHENNLK